MSFTLYMESLRISELFTIGHSLVNLETKRLRISVSIAKFHEY